MLHPEIAPGAVLVASVKGSSIPLLLTAWALKFRGGLQSTPQTAAPHHPVALGSREDDKPKRSHRKKAQHVAQCLGGRYRMQMDCHRVSWGCQEVLMGQKGSIMGQKGISLCRIYEFHATLWDLQFYLSTPATSTEASCMQWRCTWNLQYSRAGQSFYLGRNGFLERLIRSLYLLFFIWFSWVHILCTVAAVMLHSIFIWPFLLVFLISMSILLGIWSNCYSLMLI